MGWLLRALGGASAAGFLLAGLDLARRTTRFRIDMSPFAQIEAVVFAALAAVAVGWVTVSARGPRAIAALFAIGAFFGSDGVLGLTALGLGTIWTLVAGLLAAAAGVVEILRSPAGRRRFVAAIAGALVGALAFLIFVVVLLILFGAPW